jgi:cytochrome oxidase Cu insertion factor (SCO1/SenC/PrrC family)
MTSPETTDTAASEVAKGDGKKRRTGLGSLFFVALAVAVVLSGTLAYVAVRNRNSQPGLQSLRVSGLPAALPTSMANLMSLSPVPHALAPNFTLVDQHGKSMSLASFRGRTVVLEFMDPHCVDICPIVSQEFVDAYHDLGPNASRVVFAAVNVNQYFTTVADVAKFSTEHQLNTIPSWHFLTGSVPDLKAIWNAYAIQVDAPKPTADIIHTSIVLFIGPDGRKRYIGAPFDQHNASGKAYLPAGELTTWGKGIALVAQSLTK